MMATDRELYGVKGWLLCFAAVCFVFGFANLAGIIPLTSGSPDAWQAAKRVP